MATRQLGTQDIWMFVDLCFTYFPIRKWLKNSRREENLAYFSRAEKTPFWQRMIKKAIIHINLDLRKLSIVDVNNRHPYVTFRNETFDHIYSSHLIRHFNHREVRNVLVEWMCVKKNDIIKICCPDLSNNRTPLFS